jgi:hypothetical protein
MPKSLCLDCEVHCKECFDGDTIVSECDDYKKMPKLALVDIIINQGVKLNPFEIIEVERQFKEAFEKGRFKTIIRNGKMIGFFTWQVTDGKVFINNMFILKEFRDKGNLLYLRRLFKGIMFPGCKCFYWKNRKSGSFYYTK